MWETQSVQWNRGEAKIPDYLNTLAQLGCFQISAVTEGDAPYFSEGAWCNELLDLRICKRTGSNLVQRTVFRERHHLELGVCKCAGPDFLYARGKKYPFHIAVEKHLFLHYIQPLWQLDYFADGQLT